MAKYLAKFSDRFDNTEISGFIVMNGNEVESFEELALSITWDFKYPSDDDEFGLVYSNGEELLSMIEFKEISVDEAKNIKRLFNDEFGTFIGEDFLKKIIGSEDDSDFDDDDDDDDDDDKNYERNY